ncbi:hypothetical protein ACF3MZ_00240 [Paenibacillaceae bacterium WGS1546]|uniref:hypothetical protein n=1 Tax=Cohnella sp. WGS1546 TaxID=3366810 RepID=UPI00372D0EC0
MTNIENAGRISRSEYRGFAAYILETERMSATVIPELGGKIVSLRHKPTNKEWLIDSGPRKLARVAYGTNYGMSDLSGWDECFPTIVACGYPEEGKYVGTLMPDHGELWSIPWTMETDGASLQGEANGVALPYRFSREMMFADETTLRLIYAVTNAGDEELSVFWTAHPLFAVTENTAIVLPEGVKELLCVDGGRALEGGNRYAWPEGDGRLPRPLDRIGPASAQDSRKFYSEQGLPRGSAKLRERDTGEYVELKWSLEQLPYFGFWIDEGEHTGYSVCALEPCNGFYDSLAEAHKRNKLIRIAPNETVGWELEVRMGNG